MMKFKLTALEHPTPENIDCNNRKQFASTILWLEDQKIRHYRIEDRVGLRKVDNLPAWEKSYSKYKEDVGIPKFDTPMEEICWLLSYAIRLEYLDNPEKYKDINSEEVSKKAVKAHAPIKHADFINGVRVMASKLGIAYHPDHLAQLEAVKRIIHERLTPAAAAEPAIEGVPFPFEKGNDVLCDEPQLDQAARILRLLQIQSLRELQTKINETIVVVQNLTADPKTDTKLGKVGF